MRCMPREVATTSLTSPLRRLKAACSKAASPWPRETQPRSPQSWPALSAVEHSECCWQSFRKATRRWASASPSPAPSRRRPSSSLASSASASAGLRAACAAAPPRLAALGLRASGSSGRLLPGSTQRSRRCRTRTERGPGAPLCRFAGRAAKKSSAALASPSSSRRSRMQTQMAEAEDSVRPPGSARALLVHCSAENLGCHWQRRACSSSAAASSSAVAPQQSATRMASPARQEAVRTCAPAPRPRRSLRPRPERLSLATPSRSSLSPAAPGEPPWRAKRSVSSALAQASRPRRASASASRTCALARLAFVFSRAFFTCVSVASVSTCSTAAAPRNVKASQRRTRCSSRHASRSFSSSASAVRAAASSRSKAALASPGSQPRTLSGWTRRARRLYAVRTSAGPSGPPAGRPSTAKASGARSSRLTASSVTPPASVLVSAVAPAASSASQAHRARRRRPSVPSRAPLGEAWPRCSCPSLAAASSPSSGSSEIGSASSKSSVTHACPVTATTRLSPMSSATTASQPPKPWGPARRSRSRASRCSRSSAANEPTCEPR
mmetsp:Transcript_69134/g.214584  ORF Transcript_69134/g.214584 Transcript_69134/m.214584 type:complete len:555 (-) Transcript_69134:574-2238(-)